MGMLANKKRIPTPEEVEKFINSGAQAVEETAAAVQPVVQQVPVQQPVQQPVQPAVQQVMTQQVPQQVVVQQPVMANVPPQTKVEQADAMRNFNLRIPARYHKLLKRYLLDYEDGTVSMNSYFVEAITEKLRRDGLI